MEAHEALVAKRNLTLIIRSKPTRDIGVSVVDLVQVFIKLEKEKRGKWTGPKPVISYDKISGTVTVPGTSGRVIKAAVEDVRQAITDNALATSIQEAIDDLTSNVDSTILEATDISCEVGDSQATMIQTEG